MPFNGIHNLRDHNETIKIEPWQLEEIAKCARDPIYFIKNYIYINTKDKGMQLFEMYDYQETLVNTLHTMRFSLNLWCRQSGKSTTTISYLLWYALFNKDKVIAILANKLTLAQEQLQHLRESYSALPMFLQAGTREWNKRSITLSNGTRVMCAATSPDGIRGMAINILYIDEAAFIPSHVAEEFIASVFPTISSGKTTKIFITSTSNGMNHFFRLWEEAKGDISETNEGNGFVRSKVSWQEVPGRTKEWADAQLRKLGEIKFSQEFGCDFIGSSSTLIDHHFLKKMKSTPSLNIKNLPKQIKIWEIPKEKSELQTKNWEYVASIDSGYGVHQDYTIMQIFLVKSNINMYQVAKMSANDKEIDKFCEEANLLLKKYHNPNLIIEQNGPGIAATQYFHNTAEYENLLHFDPKGLHMGLWATDKMREMACILIKAFVQRGYIKIYDIETITELMSFGRVSTTKWGAMGGTHDDNVTSMYWIPYYTMSPLFYGNVVETNIGNMQGDDIILTDKEYIVKERDVINQIGNRSNMLLDHENASKYLSQDARENPHQNPNQQDEGGAPLFFRN